MSVYRVTPAAAADLEQIADYLGQRSVVGSVTVLDEIIARFDFLAEHPISGEKRSQFGPDVRVYPVGSYVIYFQPMANGAEIVRVIHGARNVQTLEPESPT